MGVAGFLRLGMVLALLWALPAAGNETDQFTLPERGEFADIGPFLNMLHYHVLEKAVERTNRRIGRALKIKDATIREQRLRSLYASGTLADAIRGQFSPGFFDMMDIENALRSPRAKKHCPNKRLAYRTPTWIYFHTHLPIDPRKSMLLFQSSTIKAYGVYFGVDKLAHFHDLGHIYFKNYLAARREGLDEEHAVRRVIKIFTEGPISERAIIGFLATGVCSNADLTSNYVGMKFYMNLTKPIRLQGKMQPPLVVRDGAYWRLNFHVRPESDFFRVYISDHWNESLNPCVYEWGMCGPIADRLRAQAEQILDFYADEEGRRRTRSEFIDLADELSTYYGENYGYVPVPADGPTIYNCCFPKERASN